MTPAQVKNLEEKVDYLTHKVDYLIDYIVDNDSVFVEPILEEELTAQDKIDIKKARREAINGQTYSLEQVKKMLNV